MTLLKRKKYKKKKALLHFKNQFIRLIKEIGNPILVNTDFSRCTIEG